MESVSLPHQQEHYLASPGSKYPPAKPGALIGEPLKAAMRGR